MSMKISDASNFLDINGLNDIRVQSNKTDKASKEAALETAAKQFEAIFMQMLLKSMRAAQDVLESDSPFNSESTKFYRDMHDQQLSVELSENGSLGLSELIVRQLGGDSENFTPSSVLRNDGKLPNNRIDGNTEQNDALAATNSFSGINGSVNQPTKLVNPLSSMLDGVKHEDKTPFAELTQWSKANMNKLAEDKPATVVEQQAPIFEQPKDFVTALIEPAKKVQAQLNVPFEVVIAQAALETGWGKKIIKTEQGESSHNLFNIKADSRWHGEKTQKETLEFEQGAMVKKKEPFRVYNSLKESLDDYVSFLSNSDRYQSALEKSSDVEHFLQGLQKAGYATDPNYANKIMGTLRKVTNLLAN